MYILVCQLDLKLAFMHKVSMYSMVVDYIMRLKGQNTTCALRDVNVLDHCYQHKHTQRLMYGYIYHDDDIIT